MFKAFDSFWREGLFYRRAILFQQTEKFVLQKKSFLQQGRMTKKMFLEFAYIKHCCL